MCVEVTYGTVGCPVSRGGSPGCGRRIAEELRLAEDARLRLALLGRCIVKGSPAQVRKELRAELKAIDAVAAR
ncbi:hypothetical protein U128_03430 [Anaplasma marginale str. Gypsy Plains]|nr:hypothetical protein U128_03430 [Anaplasma marginale str. Gypsy Plains]